MPPDAHTASTPGADPTDVRRVVSLVPSATETLVAWGVTPIAVTRFCEQPTLTAVGGTKDPDVDAVIALEPDLVVACVEENRREDAERLVAAGVAVHAIDIRTVEDVPRELARLGRALGVDVPAVELPAPAGPPTQRAFVPIWRRPWMTVNDDTYVASVLRWAGVETVFADAPERYPTVELADAVARRPNLVLAPDEPYPFGERHRPELEQVAPALLLEGKDVTWWGVRTPMAISRLRTLLDEAP